jgi:hypothetical protein
MPAPCIAEAVPLYQRKPRPVPKSHGHLGLQLSKLFLLVVLHRRGGLALDWGMVSTRSTRLRGGNNVLSPLTAAGSLWISSDTGTVPVLSIWLSSCSCSSSASSSSNSDSSIGSPIEALVMACAISLPRACCSWSLSL